MGGFAGLTISAVRVRIPLRQPFVTGTGTWHDHDAWLVRLCSADGRVGIGEASLGPGASEGDLALLAAAIRHLATDSPAPAGAVGGAAGAVGGAAGAVGGAAGAVGGAADAGFDAALLDGGWRALPDGDGGDARSVAVNGTIAVESTEASVGAACDMVAAGFGTLKLKVGSEASTTELVARIRRVRDAVGPLVGLRLDANGMWDGREARDRLQALALFDLEYVEQPLAVGPASELAQLRADVAVPIAVDESVTDLGAARRLLEARAADVLVVKPARVGGPAGSLRIAERAGAAGVGVVISTLLETGVGIGAALAVAASLPTSTRVYAHGLATARFLTSDLLLEPLAISGGRMHLPAMLGVAGRLDLAAVRRHAIDWVGEPW
jgi:L-alanine-DL-glutamate epimerase-like enolase superfamily enzyme